MSAVKKIRVVEEEEKQLGFTITEHDGEGKWRI